jgi:hypothetical protein
MIHYIMRLLIIIFLAAIILFACNSEDIKTVQTDTNVADSVRQEFLPVIKGDWVEYRYLENISKTKSPFQAFMAHEYYITMNVPEEGSGDSIEVTTGDLHEGGLFTIYLRPGPVPGSLATNIKGENDNDTYAISYEITKQDTFLYMKRYINNERTEGFKFIKARDVKTNDEWNGSFEQEVNKRLLAGTYSIAPAGIAALDTTVIFKADGSVTGFPGFKTYYVLADFGDGSNELDQIFFDFRKESRVNYAFEIKADTINLYDIVKTGEYEKEERGNLKYQLVKQ